ncbi:hypothetical protein L198_08259 [Cryptococcus wingfieldii CBS 7118]|uniref:Uncharacterized protein n=1 Tax=Cryptococcus wingfieldii CBS 7118 TaxID=1295528 RepID=A0A1E3HD12_9TREE|nr:hypothetical protein L198_08259 [Cryptococcus wingfieldii CBS 7118]ODN74238.1 hypothetical protein L198_08259 [Cryptococcus wingfieldii CBS 7118]
MSYLLKKPCSQVGCPKHAIGTLFYCEDCAKAWCLEHYHANSPHVCRTLIMASFQPGGEKAVQIRKKIGLETSGDKHAYQRTVEAIDSHKITQQASLIRPGHTCSLVTPSMPDGDYPRASAEYKIGWVNIHLPLIFDDGVKWIVRIPRRHDGDAPANLHNLIASSEVATLRVLHQNRAKVPNAWMPVEGNPDEAANGRYFFEEFVEGVPYIDGDYMNTLHTDRDRFAASLLEFAQHYIAIADIKLEVKGIGSLYPSDNSCGYTLGPITSMGTFMRPEPPYFLGPFKTLRDRYIAHIEQVLFHIRKLSFFNIAPIRSYVWLLELQDMIKECEVLGREEDDFYIRHADDWFRQTMRDSEGHLTGCLDWEWAYTTTKTEAFSSPLNLHIAHPWTEGDNALSPDELLMIDCFIKLGRPDLGDCIRQGRLYLRLEEALRIDWELFYMNRRGNFNGVLAAFRDQGQQVPGPFESEEELKVWLESLEKKRQENGELDEVRAAWKAYSDVKQEADRRDEETWEDVVAEQYKKLGLEEVDSAEK